MRTRILGIDTSCDDTAVAVVEDGRRILSSVIMSQTGLHAEHGGVVPEVAGRRHLEEMRPAVTRALAEASLTLSEIDVVAATVGPGLAGSLMVGYNLGRALALGRAVPFVPVNHLEGHIYSAWLTPPDTTPAAAPEFPVLVLIVSGGHTELVLMTGHGAYRRLGGTRDDAAGEAFDKAGRLLGLDYPGGPAIARAAAELPPGQVPTTLPRAWLRGTRDFSFSGLKTAVLHLVQQSQGQGQDRTHGGRGHATDRTAAPEPALSLQPLDVRAVAAGFQESVADVLATKTAAAAAEFDVRAVVLCGGVAANTVIRTRLRTVLPPDTVLYVPPLSLCTDNGAMIAAAAYYRPDTAVAPAAGPEVDPGLALPLD